MGTANHPLLVWTLYHTFGWVTLCDTYQCVTYSDYWNIIQVGVVQELGIRQVAFHMGRSS